MFGDFSTIAEVGHAFSEFSEGDFDGDKIYFGVGLVNKFDKIITVAVHRYEFATTLTWFQLHGFGGTATV